MPWGDHFTGAVALAAATATGWDLRPPLLVSEDVNHEIERPHIVVHQGLYYLFFCTSSQAFDPAGTAPTGLYGFVAPTLTGPYGPLNGSGLVIQNPPAQPDQAYAWLVLPDRSVDSFVNYLPADGEDPRLADAVTARASFGGTAAPTLHIALRETSTALLLSPDDVPASPLDA
jgi:levansucrase